MIGNKEKHASHEMSVSSPAPTFKSAKSIKLQRKQAVSLLLYHGCLVTMGMMFDLYLLSIFLCLS